MKNYLKTVIALSLITQISACGWLFGDSGTFRDRSDDYRSAKVESILILPNDIDSEAMSDTYAVPPISDRTSLSTKFEVPKPEPLSTDVNRDAVRINTLGSQRWILIDGSPGMVWPRLRGFLSLNQLSVQRADAVNGIIETAWLQPDTENTLKEHYQLRIEQGVQRGTSEVYVLHADIRAGEGKWPEYSSNSEREELMIKELAQYLADSAAAASVSMLAQQAIDSSGKVTLEENSNAQPYVRLILPFSRAWASLGRALKKSGFDTDDLDRSKQTYFVSYREKSGEEEEKGFFSSLFSFSSDDEQGDMGIAYTVHLKQNKEKHIIITIEHQTDETIAKDEAERLLKLIKRHLS